MYKPSNYLVVTFFLTYLPEYMTPIPHSIGYQGDTKY
jgi:hypothetical protein